jgi:hypothetical protein
MAEMDSYKPFVINRLKSISTQTIENKGSVKSNFWQMCQVRDTRSHIGIGLDHSKIRQVGSCGGMCERLKQAVLKTAMQKNSWLAAH